MATIVKRGKDRWKSVIRKKDGTYVRSQTFSTRALANEWGERQDRLEEAALASGSLAGSTPLDTLIENFQRREPAKAESLKGHLAWWRTALGGGTMLSEINAPVINRAMMKYMNSPARRYMGPKKLPKSLGHPPSGSAGNRRIDALASAYNCGKSFGVAFPSENVARFTENKRRERVLTEAELGRLLVATRASSWAKLTALVLVYISSGARKSEALRIRWCDIDWAERTATVPVDQHGRKSKTDVTRVLVLTEQVVAELEKFRQVGTALVFARADDPHSPFAFRRAFAAALDDAGIPRTGTSKVTTHTLRHSFCTFLGNASVEAHDIMRLAGHKSLQTTMRYIHPSDAKARAVSDATIGSMLNRVTAPGGN